MKNLALVLCLATLPMNADETARLRALLDRAWEAELADNPLFATEVGRHEYNDKLPSLTAADMKRQEERALATLKELMAIDRSKLPPSEAVNHDMFRQKLEIEISDLNLRDYQMPFNADSGFHTSFARLPKNVPLATTKDYEN